MSLSKGRRISFKKKGGNGIYTNSKAIPRVSLKNYVVN
jgi:hypothetical protein